MIAIIDYHAGNPGSVKNMINYLGGRSEITNDTDVIANADKYILAGVGAFDQGMQNLSGLGLLKVLEENVLIKKKPLLAICLGMQLLTEKSEEGKLPGLGWIKGETIRFNFPKTGNKFTVPHIGWNYVKPKTGNLLMDSSIEQRFYFVHSYFVRCQDPSDSLATTTYGNEFTSAVCRENIYGVQFHPEKSHRFGKALFQNFLNL